MAKEMRLVRNKDGSWRSWDNSLDDPMDRVETIEVREIVGTPMYDYVEFGCTPAQYHAGLDKLWKALEPTEVQDEDVFTLAAREITELRQEVASLRDRIEGSVGE